MDQTLVVRIVQAAASILAVVGIQVSPESQDMITQGWIALMGVLLAVKAKTEKTRTGTGDGK